MLVMSSSQKPSRAIYWVVPMLLSYVEKAAWQSILFGHRRHVSSVSSDAVRWRKGKNPSLHSHPLLSFADTLPSGQGWHSLLELELANVPGKQSEHPAIPAVGV